MSDPERKVRRWWESTGQQIESEQILGRSRDGGACDEVTSRSDNDDLSQIDSTLFLFGFFFSFRSWPTHSRVANSSVAASTDSQMVAEQCQPR